LKFIKPNKNNIDNVNNLFLFVKGIVSDVNGIRMFMKIITIDLNIIFNNTDNNDHEKNNNSKFFVNSKDILNSFLELYYFEAKDFNLYENFTYDMNNLEIGKLHKRFKELNEPIIFNKYIQKGENSNFLHFQFLSNITLETFYMNSSYFSSFPNINLNPDEYITKKNNEELIKICGDNYYVVEDKNNILSFFTLNITNNDDPSNGLFFDNPRRISFISLPKNFKFSKIYDYYFDKFNEKIILFLLIDEGLIVSLDFTGSINQKNAGATFYRDQFNFWKTTVLFINCFSLFLYFLDWSIVDKISRDIKNFIIAHFPLFNGQLFSNDLENNLRRDNWLQLSNSNTSLLSLNSNDESNNLEEEFSNSNNNININNSGSNIIRLRRRNIFEDDVFDHIPCI
jgi:hypothetical protein